MQVSDIITFGKYSWRILDIQNNAALIITEEVIERHPYHNTLMPITWAECDMRKYLNGEFYDKFTDEEKSKIITVTNKTPDNPWFGTKGGDDTEDNIFNLTIEDVVCKYFGDSSALLYNRGKNQIYWFQRKDKNDILRRATYRGNPAQWHLRTPGRYQYRIANVGNCGSAHITGNEVKYLSVKISDIKHSKRRKAKDEDHMGIRPALWLKL